MNLKKLLLIFILIVPVLAFGQRKHKDIPVARTGETMKILPEYVRCTYFGNYNSKQRRSFFPFNKAAAIRLISYESMQPNYLIRLDEDTLKAPPTQMEDTISLFVPLAPDRYFVNYCATTERKDLSSKGIDSLTDILYNIGSPHIKVPEGMANPKHNCYMPRNAILFLNDKGQVVQYIEFCFECQHYYYSSSKTHPIDYCDQKYDLLRKYFIKQGVKYGAELPMVYE